MKTLLVFPPATDPAHPPLGIPSLAAYLRERGRAVKLLDLNLLAFKWLLSPRHLELCRRRIRSRIAELEAGGALPAERAAEYQLAVVCFLSAGMLIERVQRAINELRDPATYASRERYREAVILLRRAMDIVSAAYYPTRWYPRRFFMRYLPTRSAEVLEAVHDRKENPFISFFKEQVDGVVQEAPDLVGISINYYSQLIAGMTLAAIIRRRLPGTFIVVGGGLIGFFCDDWEALAPFRKFVDAFIPYEGERPLLRLVEALERGDGPQRVPGVLRFKGARALFEAPEDPPPASDLPAPDFSGLPLGDYISPRLVLPILSVRGCYWRRCSFCSHSHLFRGSFRSKKPAQVIEEMKQLSRRHKASYFYLADECIPPPTAVAIGHALASGDGRLNWFGEMRLERGLDISALAVMAVGGCRMLMFGLESGSQRILDRMAKGIDLEHASAILRACRAHGILAYVMLFFGFPNETREDADETVRFVDAERGAITQVACTSFVLEHHSEVFRNPDLFGVTVVPNEPGEDLKTFSSYRAADGLSQEEAEAMAAEARVRLADLALLDQHILSRSHLVFLPRAEPSPPAEGRRVWAVEDDPHTIVPRRRPDLVAVELPHSLEKIVKVIAAKSAGLIALQPTRYVFSPELEKMLEVGEDGWTLLAPCDGRHSLGEILGVLPEHDQGLAKEFYRTLAASGVLGWERRP